MARTPPPEVPRGRLDEQAIGLWFTRFMLWAKEVDKRLLALEGAGTSVATATNDGTDFAAFRHKEGNSGFTGTWFLAGAPAALALSTFTPTANQFYAAPFVAPRRASTLTALAYGVTAAAAGNSRVALYSNKAPDNLYPDQLIVESGSIANTVALKSATGLSKVLTPGELYWLAYVSDNTSTVRQLQGGGVSTVLGHPFGGSNAYLCLTVTFAYAAAPATFPTGAALDTTPPPALGYQLGGP